METKPYSRKEEFVHKCWNEYYLAGKKHFKLVLKSTAKPKITEINQLEAHDGIEELFNNYSNWNFSFNQVVGRVHMDKENTMTLFVCADDESDAKNVALNTICQIIQEIDEVEEKILEKEKTEWEVK